MAETWYRDGLRFECTRCGACCTGAPGHVWVTRKDTDRLADFFGISSGEFRERYVRAIGNRYSLVERANGDCVFWSNERGCTVYEARPPQCRSYPFWPENLRTRRAWKELCEECPGAGQGRLYSVEEIARIRRGEEEAAESSPAKDRQE